MNVLITGSSGMIGNLVLMHCLQDDKISEIRCLVRKPSGLHHQKLKEIVIQNFEDYSQDNQLFKDINIAFFCLGVYTGQVKDELFKKITVNYAVAFAKTLANQSPQARICLLSGAGADRTEKSKTPFARYKGMAENQIATLPLEFYSFRPGYIYPVTPRNEPNYGYRLFRFLYPLIKIFGNKYSIPSTDLANALYNVGINGAEKQILENQDIFKYKNIIN